MKKNIFEIKLINDQKEIKPKKACTERDICLVLDFGTCAKVDLCQIDYTST